MVEMCLSVSFRGGGYDDKQPVNIHLGVVMLRRFCLRYESILDPPMRDAMRITAAFPTVYAADYFSPCLNASISRPIYVFTFIHISFSSSDYRNFRMHFNMGGRYHQKYNACKMNRHKVKCLIKMTIDSICFETT